MPDKNALMLWEKIRPVPDNNSMSEALSGEIHDPLWLLARQWQLGEFNAEDAGTAAFAHIVTLSTPLQLFQAPGPSAPRKYDIQEKPINAVSEQVPASFDLSLSLEAGREWRRMLVQAGRQNEWELFRQQPLLKFGTTAIKYEPDNKSLLPYCDEAYEQTVAALGNGRMVSGAALYRELQSHTASELLAKPDPALDELGNQWVLWVNALLGITGVESWDASRLEYSGETAAPLPNTAGIPLGVHLYMPEHNGQSMDSYSWEQRPEIATDMRKFLDEKSVVTHRKSFIPTSVSFPGMPRARWWEFEDSTIDLSNIQPRKTDLGLLLLSEFGLMYSNDWLLTPLTLPQGHIARVRNIRVTDVFGVSSIVQPSAQNTSWELFQLSNAQMPVPERWLYLPPVNNRYLQGPVTEEIHFLRDEMANMVWGVEMTVPNGLGEGTEGQTAALRLEQWLQWLAGDPAPEEVPDKDIPFTYSIGNTVPPHWIPFIPFRPNSNSAQIVLRRAAMPRFVGKLPPTRIRPKTSILQSATDAKGHYDIREEEVPATGLTVRQVWRRARWFDGRVVTWLAREKSIGRHLESSGLQFDQVL